MSLRHSFPDVKLPELRREAEPVVAVPAMRKPSEIKFRSGRDLKEIAQLMGGKNVVKITAAVGTGKSTLLPRELVLATGIPLLHVVPSKLLAVAQYDYLSAKFKDIDYALSLDGTESYSTTGITIATSAAVWSKLLLAVNDKDKSPLGKVVLFMDESHESDAFTYALHKVAHAVSGVQGVVFASANHDPETTPMRENQGQLESRKFSARDTPKTWNPHDLDKPWSMSSFNGSVLMFVEPNMVADKLVSAYVQAGATAYRLTSKMDVSMFRRAYADCMNPGSGIVVLIADYSFRSGFTFDVSTIVDSAMVAYGEVEGTIQKIKYRQAYEIERYQAQGRGARSPGSACVCFYPDVIPEISLCNLEFLEMDAAAILFRCYGYAVPSELRRSKFASGKIPKDLVYSFNDTNALICQSDTLMYDFVYVSEATQQKLHDEDLLNVVRSYVESPVEPSTLFKDLSLKSDPVVSTRMVDAHSLLHALTSMAASSSCVSPPNYYMVPGLKNDVIVTKLYGEDVDKCVDEIIRHPQIAQGFTNSDVREIIAMLLNSYNMLNATVIGTSFAANHEDELMKAAAAFPSLTKNWAEQVQEKVRVGSAKLNVYASVLNDLKPSSMHYVKVDPFSAMEDKVANKVASQLIDAIRVTSRKLDASSYQESMLNRVDMPGFKRFKQDTLEIEDGDVQTAKVVLAPCKVGRRNMWEIHVRPNDSERWQINDFVEACAKVIEKGNVSCKFIADIKVPSYVSESKVNKIMARIREGDYHKTGRQFVVS